MTWVWIASVFVGSYLIGSIPFGLIFGFLVRGVDIRQHGSRSIGATNAARVIGWKWFPAVMLLDALKGAGPCFAGLMLTERTGFDLALVAAIGALLGHFYSVYIGFKGGKGVATGLGVVLVLTVVPDSGVPWPALCALGVFALALLITRFVSAASMASALSIPAFYAFWLGADALREPLVWRFGFLVVVCLFVVLKHRANMRRILKGEEPRIGRKPQEAA